MQWLGAVVVAVGIAAPALGSPASDAAYEAGRRQIAAGAYPAGLALLERAAAADPDSSSGHRARLLQLLVLSAQVGRALSALTTYDGGLQGGRSADAAALRQQRDAVAEDGYRELRQLLHASEGYREHLPPPADCRLELPAPEGWNLDIISSAETKIESGRALSPSERGRYEQQDLRIWTYLTLSQLFGCPGRDDAEVVAKVREAMKADERIDPWIVLAATIDTMAATINRSLLEGELGRARVVHHEMRKCIVALLLKAPADEGIAARAKVELSVKHVFGEARGAEWFHDMELATRLVKADQEAAKP